MNETPGPLNLAETFEESLERFWGEKRHYHFERHRGWACDHCGGMTRGEDAMIRHIERRHAPPPR